MLQMLRTCQPGAVPDGAWVAIQVQSNAERNVDLGLKQRGYESFLPLYKIRRQRSHGSVTLELPLFRGYLFCRWAAFNPDRIVAIPRVVRIIGNGRTPIPVDECEITALQTISRAGVAAKPWPFLRVGQHIQVVAGPLRGAEGSILRLKDEWRLVVSVNLLQRSVAAEIDRNCIAPANSSDATSSWPRNGAG